MSKGWPTAVTAIPPAHKQASNRLAEQAKLWRTWYRPMIVHVAKACASEGSVCPVNPHPCHNPTAAGGGGRVGRLSC